MQAQVRGALLAGVAAATVAALAPGARAADLAVMMATEGAGREAMALLGDVLNAEGYEVYERPVANRAEVFAALNEALGRLGEVERLVMVYAGPAAAARGAAWLLPGELSGQGLLGAAEAGAPLEALLALASARPGRAAVVLALPEADWPAQEDPPAGFPALAPGVAGVAPPQGVLMIAGPEEAALAAATEALLSRQGVAAGLAAAGEGVEATGFVAPDAAFLPEPPTPPGAAATPPEPTDAAPGTAPAPGPEASPAEAAEAALSLDQAARRRIQEQLTVLGYSTPGIDGIFGPGTRGAIAEWQKAQGFAGDGFVTREQLERLGELAAARSAPLAAAAEAARREEEAADAAFWRATGEGGHAADYRAYLARYPDGIYAGEARAALERLEAEARAEAGAADAAAWRAAEAAGGIAAYRDYLRANPEGAFAEQARARIDDLEARPARERASEAAAAAEKALGLNRGSRALIEGQLAALGYEVGEPDGDFNNRTRRALREFQTRQGLAATGYVDQATVQALIVASLGLR